MSAECPLDRTLNDFVAGELPPDESTIVSAHLRGCTRCANRVQNLECGVPPTDLVLNELARVAPPPPSDPEFLIAVEQLLLNSPVASTLQVGDLIDDYRLAELLGEGGMGVVYRAIHTKLEKEVALKVIRRARAFDPETADRFRREMKAAGKLDHPNLVLATDAGVSDGIHYLVMKYFPGTNLARLVCRDGPLPPERACELVRQAALGLHHAHEHGLVHRDVKPSNLLLGTDGVVRVLDLGLARLPDELPRESIPMSPAEAATASAADDTLTTPGQQLGTRDYTAPEQLRDSHAVDQRADVYGLGCTLVYLLTGRAYKLWEGFPPQLPAELWTKFLAVNPDDRFPTAQAAAEALATLCAPPATQSKFRGWILPIALVAVAALAVGAVIHCNQPPQPVSPGDDPKAIPEPVAIELAPPPREVSPRGALPMTPVQSRALQKQHADHIRQPVSVKNSLGMEMVLIPPGEFNMSTTYSVTLTKPFRIGTMEVTAKQFQLFVSDTKYKTEAELKRTNSSFITIRPPGQRPAIGPFNRLRPGWGKYEDDQPITYLTWNDVDAFLKWLSGKEQHTYRLPTYAEWIWACRAGTATKFYWGENAHDIEKHAWMRLANIDRPKPVGMLTPNAWGLHDTLGNVSEMVHDFAQNPLPSGHAIDPTGPATGERRILCGGSYMSLADFGEKIPASEALLDYTDSTRGFRVVLEP